MGKKLDAHILFNLTAANDKQIPVKQYIELDVNFMGLKVLNVGFLIIDEPNRVLDKKHHTKSPGQETSYQASRNYQLEHDMACIQGLHEQIWGRKI